LLLSAPDLRVLATSRAVLHLSGEKVYQVAPLALPETMEGRSADVLLRYAAVALFVQRAQARQPGFAQRLLMRKRSCASVVCWTACR
jgi:non-specific serine/threonine protein kinase